MVIDFKNGTAKYNYLKYHTYTLIDYPENIVKLYDQPRYTIYITTLDTFGKKTSKTCDWFDPKAAVMIQI